jgi:hypothetical protein
MRFLGVLQVVWVSVVTCLVVLFGIAWKLGPTSNELDLTISWHVLADTLMPDISPSYAHWLLDLIVCGVIFLPYFGLEALKKRIHPRPGVWFTEPK